MKPFVERLAGWPRNSNLHCRFVTYLGEGHLAEVLLVDLLWKLDKLV